MSLGDVYIVMFYGRPENVNLIHTIKFITIIFLEYSFKRTTRKKAIEFIQRVINFEETSQGCPNYILK